MTISTSRIAIVTTLVTDSATISTLYVNLDNSGPALRSSKNRVGRVRNLRNTPRRNELMTFRPMYPSDASVANPDRPRTASIPAKARGSHFCVTRFCATNASSMSGCSNQTRPASAPAVAAIPSIAKNPMSLCGIT